MAVQGLVNGKAVFHCKAVVDCSALCHCTCTCSSNNSSTCSSSRWYGTGVCGDNRADSG
jgi:hypothetical protein